ncbi:hypothetical protein P8452_37744 [Trifolium repens]|nr:hypothetical protein P8452_37744 [Trifolium repens]
MVLELNKHILRNQFEVFFAVSMAAWVVARPCMDFKSNILSLIEMEGLILDWRLTVGFNCVGGVRKIEVETKWSKPELMPELRPNQLSQS